MRPSKVIDASGLSSRPGFIDLHTHYDAPAVLGSLLYDFQLARRDFGGHRQLRLWLRPCHPEDRERAMLTMTRDEAIPYASMKAGMPWDWVSFPGIPRQRRARA